MITASQALEAFLTIVGEQRQAMHTMMQAIAQMTTRVQASKERLT